MHRAALIPLLLLAGCANDGYGALSSAIAPIAKQSPAAPAGVTYATEETRVTTYGQAKMMDGAKLAKLKPYAQPQSWQALRGLLGPPNRIEASSDGTWTEIYEAPSPDGIQTGGRLSIQYRKNKGAWWWS